MSCIGNGSRLVFLLPRCEVPLGLVCSSRERCFPPQLPSTATSCLQKLTIRSVSSFPTHSFQPSCPGGVVACSAKSFMSLVRPLRRSTVCPDSRCLSEQYGRRSCVPWIFVLKPPPVLICMWNADRLAETASKDATGIMGILYKTRRQCFSQPHVLASCCEAFWAGKEDRSRTQCRTSLHK